MPQMLAVRYTNKGGNTQIQPLRNNNGTFVAFGNPYTPTGLTPDANTNNVSNLCVQFGAEFWCGAGRELRRYNSSTGNWDLDTLLSDIVTSIPGIYIGRGPSGALRALVVYQKSNQPHYRFLDAPAGSWSAEVNTTLGMASTGPTAGLVHNNQLHQGHGVDIFTLDFASLGASKQTFTGNPFHHDPAFCRAKNRLFALMWPVAPTVNTRRNLYEFTGGAWALMVDGTVETAMPHAGNSGIPNAETPNIGMFYDEAGDSLIAHTWIEGDGGTHGWKVSRIPLALTGVTEIQGTVVPGGVDFPNGPLLTINDCRFTVEVDQDTDPTVPVTYVWILRNNGAWGRFQWNGVGSAMTALGSGGDRGVALSHNSHGGGERFYDGSTTLLPAYHVEEAQARDPIIGGTRIYLRGYQIDETGGAPTPIDATVGLYWGTSQGQPDNLATISNPVKVSGSGATPMVVGNKITDFTFDGVTIYSVDWAAVSDGVASQQFHALMPHVEI